MKRKGSDTENSSNIKKNRDTYEDSSENEGWQVNFLKFIYALLF